MHKVCGGSMVRLGIVIVAVGEELSTLVIDQELSRLHPYCSGLLSKSGTWLYLFTV